jgi:HK97 family phage prohead protease
MELRRVEQSERLVVGLVVPYDETTYLVPNPDGERIRRGAFSRSIKHREQKVPLLRAHDPGLVMGRSRCFTETAEGLLGEFVVNDGARGDDLLEDARTGYLDGMSVGFSAVRTERADDGVREVVEARLVEVSMVGVPAYEGAAMLAVRNAHLPAVAVTVNTVLIIAVAALVIACIALVLAVD